MVRRARTGADDTVARHKDGIGQALPELYRSGAAASKKGKGKSMPIQVKSLSRAYKVTVRVEQ